MCEVGSVNENTARRRRRPRALGGLDVIVEAARRAKGVTHKRSTRNTHVKSITPIRAIVALALVSACAGWAISTTQIVSRVTDYFWGKREGRESPACGGIQPLRTDLAVLQAVAEDFEPRVYHPPFWARNSHMHTIVSSGDVERIVLGDREPLNYWRERWPTPDGDFVEIDWLPAEEQEEDIDIHDDVVVDGVEQPGELTEADLSKVEEVAMEELERAVKLAESTHGASLGLGHPDAPSEVHEENAEWMSGAGGGGRRLVVLMHGLESSSTAPMTQRFSRVFSQRGFDVAAVNFRGCGSDLGKNPIGYHLGFTDDLQFIIEEIHRRFPSTWDRLYLSGYSLGGNVITKYLGEQGDKAREMGIHGAAVGCVPFEPALGSAKLERDPVGRFLYMPIFLSLLVGKAEAHAKLHPDKLDLDALSGIKTFTRFNEEVTLPLFSFQSMEAFYDTVNAANYLSSVRVPMVVVNARDDPFIDERGLPSTDRVGDAPVKLVYHEYGGHCGFVTGKDLNPSGRKWPNMQGGAEEKGGEVGKDGVGVRASSGSKSHAEGRWLPVELLRFIEHLEHSMHSVNQ